MWLDYGFTVFYMGDNPNIQNSFSKYLFREKYLERTLNNMRLHCKKIVVFVSNDFDKNIVLKYHNTCIQLEVNDSMMIPLEACKYIQKNIDLSDNSIIYYTEADQLLEIKDNIKSLVIENAKKDDIYISMHRMHPYYDDTNLQHGFKITLDGLDYISFNTKTIHDRASYSPEFYIGPNWGEAYGAAMIINMKNFKKVNFRIHNNSKLESASFSCFYSLTCLKSKNIEELYINHLSGYEYSQEHLPPDIERKEPPLMYWESI